MPSVARIVPDRRLRKMKMQTHANQKPTMLGKRAVTWENPRADPTTCVVRCANGGMPSVDSDQTAQTSARLGDRAMLNVVSSSNESGFSAARWQVAAKYPTVNTPNTRGAVPRHALARC